MRLKSYLKMKDSGIDWIGEIPEHWEINKIKYTSYTKGRIGWQGLTTEEYIDKGPYLITGTDFHEGVIDWKTCNHVEEWRYDQDHHIQIKENDILITKDGTIGKIALVKNMPDKTTLNTGILVVRPLAKKYVPSYLFWLLNSNQFIQFINLIKSGSTIQHLYQETFKNFQFTLPNTIDEQKDISNFLNIVTKKIDSKLQKNQKMIDLLKEKQSSLVQYAITKGLDKTVQLKDSGIDWMGKIPQHWELTKLKKVCTLFVPMRNKPKEFDGNIPWIRIEDIEGKFISNSKSKQYVSPKIINEMNLRIFPVGTVICSCTATIGVCAITQKELVTNQQFVGIYSTSINNEFLYYYLLTQTENLKNIAYGPVAGYITRQRFENFQVILPSINEQKDISEFLRIKTTHIESLIKQINIQIEKLKEFRKSIISSAITGKIDVTNLAQ